MAGRVVIHAGFHKTGTTTVQRMLHANGPVLWPVMALGLRWKLQPILHAARAYSTWGDPVSLALVGERFAAYLEELSLGPKRSLLISSEELSGHMPGRGDLATYAAAPALMAELARVVRQKLPGRPLDFAFSTRAPGPWRRSAWREHVKSSRMTLDLDTFEARYPDAADFIPVLEQIRAAVAPAPVHVFPLEDTASRPLGPADPIIALMGLGAQRHGQLRPHRPVNRALPPEITEKLLALNRGTADDETLRADKAALLAPFLTEDA